tara:strand:+ start:3031 stop:3258 length:228 start_codon:yes stop_codon:yes gene_type:complete
MIWDILSNDLVQYAVAAIAALLALCANNLRQRKLGAKKNQDKQEANDNAKAKDIRSRVNDASSIGVSGNNLKYRD